MGKLFSSVKKWIGNYLYFSKATLCIRGLVLSHSFVNHVVVAVLIIYVLETIWKPKDENTEPPEDSSQLAAIAINMLDGVSSIMVCVFACITNIYGPFKVIACTNAAYLLGLVLLWWSSTNQNNNASDIVFFGAGLLLALGEAGRPAALPRFLEDQCSSEANHKNKLPETNRSTEKKEHISTRNEEQEDYISTRKEEDDKQKLVEEEKKNPVETRQTALWSLPWFIGAALPVAFVKRSWRTQLLVSMIFMGVSYLFFWYGVYAYSKNIRNDSNDPAVEDAPRDPGLCQAIKSLSASEEAPSWKFWLKPDSRKRYYKEMLVMCLAFIVYSLVEATGSTFFFYQMNHLEYHIGNFEISYIHFYIIQSLSSSVISFLWRLLVPKQLKGATLVRIGCGLICSVLCMAAAWQVEIHRNRKIHDTEEVPLPEELPMNILWLVPQFSLLGFMRGLAVEGLIEFFADRVDGNGKRKARYYGSYASELVLGIGTLLTAVSILGFRHTWLVNNIYHSRLDKYYRALVFIGVANLGYYFCVAFYFYKKEHKSPVSSAPDGNEQSETWKQNRYHHDVSSGSVETPVPEELKSSTTFGCCSSFF